MDTTLLGLKVFVYFNLHRKVWSIKALSGPDKGRVVAHAYQVSLRDVTGRVSAAGRARVLAEGRKNVHAGLVGTLTGYAVSEAEGYAAWDGPAITYNPYKYSSFVYKHNEQPWSRAGAASLKGRAVTVAGLQY